MPIRPVARIRAVLRDRVLSAPDTWERHVLVASLVGAPRDLVDVGGLSGQLASFLPGTKVLAVNVGEPADMLVPDGQLPFVDDAFSAATSLDVLEHVPGPKRGPFVTELLRVSRGRCVLCCPLGTPEHADAECEIQDWYRSLTGQDHPWLVEHLDNGLPTLEELRELYAPHRGTVRLLFHGDFREVNDQFRKVMLARHRRRPLDLASFASFRLGYRPGTSVSDEPTRYTNRVFVVTDS